MNVLAFDTTTSACSAAVCRRGEARAARQIQMERGHAEALVPLLDEMLEESGLAYGDLNIIAVTCGPGAFTGIRIGLAAARGLSLALGIPAIGVGTLPAMAATAARESKARTLAIAMNTKRRDLFVQVFDRQLAPLRPAQVCSPNEALTTLARFDDLALSGDGMDLMGAALGDLPIELLREVTSPSPVCIAELALARQADGATGAPPAPIYLRPPEARRPADTS